MSDPHAGGSREGASEEALTVDRRTAETLDASDPARPAAAPQAAATIAADEAPRYPIDGGLGAGGMGEVWLARDPRIGRSVALKTIRGGRAVDEEARDRFVREARVQGQLEHPAIVPVYDLGRDASGALYFTMKRVRGLSLLEVLRRLRAGDEEARRSWSRRRLLTAFTSVCNAVEFAHRHGVLHRDLKPGNVMLGDFGEVYVLDWGLARLRSDEAAATEGGGVNAGVVLPDEGAALTLRGQALGTPGYMAPEQARGQLDLLDARTDVYALGVILFEILALEPLHRGSTTGALLASTLAEVDARPSRRAPAAEIPPELDDLCARAAAFDAASRLPSARALCDAVERYLDGDRDLERRRQLAGEAVVRASSLAERAFTGHAEEAATARRGAMSEVSRALAFDADNVDARRLLLRLLSVPPADLPPEVVAEQAEAALSLRRTGARVGRLAYLTYFLYFPLLLVRGVRVLPAVLLSAVPWLAAFVMAQIATRDGSGVDRAARLRQATAMVAVSSLAVIAGPFLVPIGAIAAAVALTMVHDARDRRFILGWAVAAILVPFALEWTHLVPPSHRYEHGSLVMLPRVVQLPAISSLAFFLILSVGALITAATLVARLRDALTATQLRLQLLTWQLRALLPDETTAPSAPSMAPGQAPPPRSASAPLRR